MQVLLAGGGAAKTHAEFITYVEGVSATDRSGSNTSSAAYTAALRIATLAESGTMWGTSWGGYFTADSVYNRIVQHAVENYAAFSAIVSNSSKVLIWLYNDGSLSTYDSIDRNSYTSSSYTTWDGQHISRIEYWDFALGKARVSTNPYGQTAHTDLTF
jgi:hypothetical protein